jgi:hypothetical protein
MRAIRCNKCSHIFRSGGISRVMRKIAFHFCPKCWEDQRGCEQFMNAISRPVTALPVEGK